MKELVNKVLDRRSFLYFSLFYLVFKYICFNKGTILTYVLFAYAITIFLYDFYLHKELYKFKGWMFSYLMCISTIISCLIVAKTINVYAIKGISIFFINFFMYLPMFDSKDIDYVKKTIEIPLYVIICTSFIINIIGISFAIFGKEIVLFGTQFGAIYGKRLVTVRETANETAWFAIFSIIASIYFLIKNNKFVKYSILKTVVDKKTNIFLIINIIIQLTTYILSGNRSSIFGVSCGLLVVLYAYSVYKDDIKLKKMIIALSIIALIVAISYLFIRIYNGKGSDSVRFDMYAYGIYLLPLTNILFGSSLVNLRHDLDVNFEIIWNKYPFKTDKKYLKQLTFDGNAHNVFIQQLNTNGIVGVVILVSFLIYVIKNLICSVKNMSNNKNNFLIKALCIFFVIFGIVVGNISWSIIGTMTCFVNLMFFLSASALINIDE